MGIIDFLVSFSAVLFTSEFPSSTISSKLSFMNEIHHSFFSTVFVLALLVVFLPNSATTKIVFWLIIVVSWLTWLDFWISSPWGDVWTSSSWGDFWTSSTWADLWFFLQFVVPALFSILLPDPFWLQKLVQAFELLINELLVEVPPKSNLSIKKNSVGLLTVLPFFIGSRFPCPYPSNTGFCGS